MKAEYGMVMTTVADAEAGQRLAAELVEQRLAACVQALPIQSTYRWKGAVQRDAEILLLIKTKAALYAEVEAFIRARHTYETPEIIHVPIVAGSAGYLQWLAAETR